MPAAHSAAAVAFLRESHFLMVLSPHSRCDEEAWKHRRPGPGRSTPFETKRRSHFVEQRTRCVLRVLLCAHREAEDAAAHGHLPALENHVVIRRFLVTMAPVLVDDGRPLATVVPPHDEMSDV